MKNNKLIKIIVTLVISMIALSACNLFSGGSQATTAQVETMAAETVSARLTQIAVDKLFAEATQQVLYTSTPQSTWTPSATATPTNTPIPPTSTPIPIPCNIAQFLDDVTVKDNTTLYAGEAFTKTWRVKNVGACSWTKDYQIYFQSGNSMSAASANAFPKVVNPGESVDLSVSMVAPSNTGDFTGSWMLKASNGVVFGAGPAGNAPLTVKIKVASIPSPKDANTTFDFVKNYCTASWRTNAGSIGCPTSGADYKNGSIMRSYAPILENGVVDDEGALITIPAVGGDGMIQGKFPKTTIHTGDRFRALLFCSVNKVNCNVSFQLLYSEVGNDTITSLQVWDKKFGDPYIQADVDLSALDGKEIIFYLKVLSKGDPTDDFAQWMAARITHP